MPADLATMHVHETDAELVIEVEVPPDVELPRLGMSVRGGVLTIRLPRARRTGVGPRVNPDASGV